MPRHHATASRAGWWDRSGAASHPVALPIWLAGLWFLLVGAGRRFAAVGRVFLTVLLTTMVLHGKVYYLAPVYPMVLAAGAVAIEVWTGRLQRPQLAASSRIAVVALVAVAGAVTVPLATPLLQPADRVAYQRALGIEPQKTEVAHDGPLPQLWGDQFGWPELVDEVARVYRALPERDRARAAIFASNYGEAGAINLFGPEHHLPPAVCAHQTHSLWGPPEDDPEVVIWLQRGRESLEELCGSVEMVGEYSHPWGMAVENRPIYLCRDPVAPLSELWPELTHWN